MTMNYDNDDNDKSLFTAPLIALWTGVHNYNDDNDDNDDNVDVNDNDDNDDDDNSLFTLHSH